MLIVQNGNTKHFPADFFDNTKAQLESDKKQLSDQKKSFKTSFTMNNEPKCVKELSCLQSDQQKSKGKVIRIDVEIAQNLTASDMKQSPKGIARAQSFLEKMSCDMIPEEDEEKMKNELSNTKKVMDLRSSQMKISSERSSSTKSNEINFINKFNNNYYSSESTQFNNESKNFYTSMSSNLRDKSSESLPQDISTSGSMNKVIPKNSKDKIFNFENVENALDDFKQTACFSPNSNMQDRSKCFSYRQQSEKKLKNIDFITKNNNKTETGIIGVNKPHSERSISKKNIKSSLSNLFLILF